MNISISKGGLNTLIKINFINLLLLSLRLCNNKLSGGEGGKGMLTYSKDDQF